ncbi:MAG: hypothetical protein ACR2OE_16470 [Thermomicrobiales bacterium]
MDQVHIIPDLVLSLRSSGIDLRWEEGKLIARPARLITQDIRHIIELHRDDLIACLGNDDPTAGHSSIDRVIRRFDGITLVRERIALSLERSLSRYARTHDPLWAEVASIWAQTLTFRDAVEVTSEGVESSEAEAA